MNFTTITTSGSVAMGTPSTLTNTTTNSASGTTHSHELTGELVETTTGSPLYYGARAWVNFNGTGTVSIRASANVSSITDNNTGDYTINFSTAMPDANYSLAGITNEGVLGNRSQGWCIRGTDASLVTTSSVRIDVGSQSAGTAADLQVVTLILFR
jgi:hypothetical protein